MPSSVKLPPHATTVVAASYNIHGGIGGDGHFVPKRIVEVLREIDADIIALQEVESRATGFDMLNFLAAELQLHAVPGPTLLAADGDYGNGLLTRYRPSNTLCIDLSVPGREPRGAIDTELEITGNDAALVNGNKMRIIATHLGLRPAERRRQVQQLLAIFERERALPTIFLGDVNEWWLTGRPLRWLHRHFESTPAPASFPARWPLFALDRIWIKPRALLISVAAHASPLAQLASDHLPVVARIALTRSHAHLVDKTTTLDRVEADD
ncbi:MAG TPA: endonuclease/exonuclease/phosphatase family protein [Spongiibacteraceae bacterium]|nr:endonuclease/exonuclease/phosphatase family protein [Spongiibacteraceae bacterium]